MGPCSPRPWTCALFENEGSAAERGREFHCASQRTPRLVPVDERGRFLSYRGAVPCRATQSSSVRPLSSVLAERASADFEGATPAEKERAMMRSVEVGSRPVRS